MTSTGVAWVPSVFYGVPNRGYAVKCDSRAVMDNLQCWVVQEMVREGLAHDMTGLHWHACMAHTHAPLIDPMLDHEHPCLRVCASDAV